jgi:hypothetical protein
VVVSEWLVVLFRDTLEVVDDVMRVVVLLWNSTLEVVVLLWKKGTLEVVVLLWKGTLEVVDEV